MEFYKQYTLQLSPFPAYILFRVATNLFKPYAGACLGTVINEYENGISRGYFVRREVIGCGDIVSEKLISGELKMKKVWRDFEERTGSLLEKAHKINQNRHLCNLADKDIARLFTEFCSAYSDMYVPAFLPFACDFSLEKMASNELRSQLGLETATLAMSHLTAPTGMSWTKKEELELAKLAQKATDMGIRNAKGLLDSPLKADFYAHISEWAWLAYDYQGTPLATEYFIMRLKTALKDPAGPVRQIQAEKKRTERERGKALKIAKASRGARMALLLGELAYFKEYRKGIMSKSLYLVEPLLTEIANRIGVHISRARFLWPGEIQKALNEPAKWKKALESRHAYSIYIQTTDGFGIFIGGKARKEMKKFSLEKPGEEIKGTIACMGFATGKVRIITTPMDLHKMRKGDILVSPMTTPDLMPAIKLAAGIITDTGGMTSHAAIIAREFKIPCIIGTQHATEILRDGDMVEVDANRGIVKRIK